MTTPIADFVRAYADSDSSRFHMPAHKGAPFLGCEALDITEISGADVLYSANGIIEESEANASALFGSLYTLYSTEGSTLAIKTMLALIKKKAPDGTKVLAARNAHKAFIYACALLDIEVEWLYPAESSHLCSCPIDPKELDSLLSSAASLPSAVYITSPDYLGGVADIRGISEVCHEHSIPLLVDNAHGAYLAFTSPSMHPLSLGADMCCDSAHKTLPVLTGGAYLHVSRRFDYFDKSQIRAVASLFASTSPSYLILQSLDLCNRYIADGYRERLSSLIERIKKLNRTLEQLGFKNESAEPLKLVFSKRSCNYSGFELAETFKAFKIELEFRDGDNAVLMLSPELREKDFERLLSALSSLPARNAPTKADQIPSIHRPVSILSIRQAMLSPSETVSPKDSIGRICAAPTVSCPPAIPVIISGELIDERCAELLTYYGIEKIEVVK